MTCYDEDIIHFILNNTKKYILFTIRICNNFGSLCAGNRILVTVYVCNIRTYGPFMCLNLLR